MMGSALRRLAPTRAHLAVAGGIALSAYVLQQQYPVKAAEPEAIFVINGCAPELDSQETRNAPLDAQNRMLVPIPSRRLRYLTAPLRGCRSFYMAMREKYTTPGTSIYYYLVEWDPAKLSWEDFRGKVLGATDPKEAADGALRKEIFQTWKSLGLKSEPNVGDNGVHASASPFEAMAERLNWLGAKLETDAFGKAMLESGIPKDTIMAWTKDPQVPFEGKKSSLFDLLEDLDYDECLAKAQAIAGVSGKRPAGKQQAYVFIKPHAVTEKTKKLAASKFASAGISARATPPHAALPAH